MEKSEFIEFDLIRLSLTLQPNLFSIYLKEVYNDLSQRPDSDKDKGISKITYNEYMKLPVFINNKLFSSFDKDNDGFLNIKEFSNGMTKLYLGNFEDTAHIIFSIFDFDKDGVIKKGDVKLLLSYLPIKSNEEKTTVYKNQMESLEELDEILNETFGKNTDSINFDEFVKIIENDKSDIYIQLLCFLYYKKPFEEDSINQYKKLKKNKGDESSSPTKNTKKTVLDNQNSRRFPSPSKKTRFLPAENYLNINVIRRIEENKMSNSPIDSPTSKAVDKTNQTSSNFKITLNSTHTKGFGSPGKKSIGMAVPIKKMSTMKIDDNECIRMPNRKITTNTTKSDYDEMLKSSKNYFDSPTKLLKKPDQDMNKLVEFSLENNLINLQSADMEEDDELKYLNLEDSIHILEKDGKLKKYYVSLIGKEMSIYKTNAKDDLISLQNLSGCFIKDLGTESKVFEKEKYFGFSIIISKDKIKTFYTNKIEDKDDWVSCIKKAIGYEIFTDFYEVNQTLGEGLFGIVKKAIHRKTNQVVAVKIIAKEKLRPGEIDLIRTEIDLMKLFQHPNIVKLLDHFENSESIYIVMEYLEGGTLLDYMENKNFILSEKIIAKILFCIGSVIRYLNSYGVIHRDLKPENIMLADKTDNPLIKIIDFGLTRTLAPGERLAEGFGTITYVAPEVLTRKPYNKQIDIWSMGVILYFLLTGGKLPFDDENNNEEIIAKKSVLMDPSFPEELFSKRSKSAMLLINDCLVKDPEKRITIDVFMKNEWLKSYINSKDSES